MGLAALEDVRLAPSPRQQRPAPGPCAASLLLTLPGPQPRTQALQTGEGHTPQLGPVFLSSRLFCSIPASPPPLVGHRWAGAWVSLGPSLFPAPTLGTRAGAFAPQQSQGRTRAPLCLSLSQLRRPLGRMLSPSCPRAGRDAARAGFASEPGRRERGVEVAQTTLDPCLASAQGTGSEMKPTVQSGQRRAGGARAAPVVRPQEGGPWARGPAPRSHRQGLAAVMSSGSVLPPTAQ